MMNKIFKTLICKRSVFSQQLCNVYLRSEYHNWSFCRLSSVKLNANKQVFTWNKADRKCLHLTNCVYEQHAVSAETDTNELETQQSEEIDFKIAKYIELANDIETKKKILMFLMEHEVAKLEGRRVPTKLTVDNMKELLSMYSFSARVKYMKYLFVRETDRASEKRRKETRKLEREEILRQRDIEGLPKHLLYAVNHNTMLIRIRRKSVMHFYNQRLANAVLHGQKIIIDMDYDCFMRKQDCLNCGDQLLEMYSVNRKNTNPYDIILCNVQRSSTTMSAFSRYMPNIYAPDNFVTITDLNYSDLFPKEKLVYITPNAKDPMTEYDPNAVYILGGLVDKCVREPVVMAKAKREGIKAVHLPFDDYLMWGRGSKSLPLNILVNILLDMKNTGDWNKAFQHVPKRRIVRNLNLFEEF